MAASSKDQKQEVKKACQEVRAAFNDPIPPPPDKKQGESLDFSMLGYAARRTNRILHALCQRGNNLGCHVLAACGFSLKSVKLRGSLNSKCKWTWFCLSFLF